MFHNVKKATNDALDIVAKVIITYDLSTWDKFSPLYLACYGVWLGFPLQSNVVFINTPALEPLLKIASPMFWGICLLVVAYIHTSALHSNHKKYHEISSGMVALVFLFMTVLFISNNLYSTGVVNYGLLTIISVINYFQISMRRKISEHSK